MPRKRRSPRKLELRNRLNKQGRLWTAFFAGKTARLCDGQSGVVLVVCENEKGRVTAYGPALDAFRKGLGNSAQVTATEVVPTHRVMLRGIKPLPADKLVEPLQQFPSAD
jgi:hypothetical protein